MPHPPDPADDLGPGLAGLIAQTPHAATHDPPFAPPADAAAPIQALAAALNALVADLRAEKAQADAASRAKTEFLANLSHELRSPLNAILGFTEMLAEGYYGPVAPEQKNRLDRVMANGHSLLGLLNEVLDLTRIERGRVEIHPTPIDLPLLLRTVAAEHEAAVATKALALRLDVAPDLGSVDTDVDRLRQILGNLLANAVRFTEAGEVTLRGATHPARPDWVRLAVADTGIGIPAAAQAHVWEEFYQVNAAQRRTQGGAGLGLPICRKLTLLLGGEIAVESTEGAGTCFTVDLPRTAPTPAA